MRGQRRTNHPSPFDPLSIPTKVLTPSGPLNLRLFAAQLRHETDNSQLADQGQQEAIDRRALVGGGGGYWGSGRVKQLGRGHFLSSSQLCRR